MKTRIIYFLSGAVVLGVGMQRPADLYASQTRVPGVEDIRPGIPASAGEITPGVQARLARGDSLRSRLRFTEAQVEYRGAVELARRQGHLPSLTMWRLAGAFYHAGDLARASVVLDQLAVEAARVGDIAVQALAIYNSAWLNGEAGRQREAATRVAHVERLLGSPYMPVALRIHLSQRLTAPRDVAERP